MFKKTPLLIVTILITALLTACLPQAPIETVDCSTLGENWIKYEDDNVPFSFCYDQEWEAKYETRQSPSIGTQSYVKFQGYDWGHGQYEPVVVISSKDFSIVGDTDGVGGSFCWNEDETELLPRACELEEEELEIGGKAMLRSHTHGIDVLSHEKYESISYEFELNDMDVRLSIHGRPTLEEKNATNLSAIAESLSFD